MNLKEYFEKNNLKIVEFSLKSEVSVNTIYRALRGERIGYYKTAEKLEKACEGQVTIKELMK